MVSPTECLVEFEPDEADKGLPTERVELGPRRNEPTHQARIDRIIQHHQVSSFRIQERPGSRHVLLPFRGA